MFIAYYDFDFDVCMKCNEALILNFYDNPKRSLKPILMCCLLSTSSSGFDAWIQFLWIAWQWAIYFNQKKNGHALFWCFSGKFSHPKLRSVNEWGFRLKRFKCFQHCKLWSWSWGTCFTKALFTIFSLNSFVLIARIEESTTDH